MLKAEMQTAGANTGETVGADGAQPGRSAISAVPHLTDESRGHWAWLTQQHPDLRWLFRVSVAEPFLLSCVPA